MPYRVRIITDPPRYMAEKWPELGESMLPRIGEQIRAESGFTMTVEAIIHSRLPADLDMFREKSCRVVEIQLRR